jgi:undecaprenyl-phosphate 4-deoxy-4-formamido-L-arabinose transferase
MASSLTKFALQGVMDKKVARKVSAFRAFRSQVAKAFRNYEGPFVSIDVLLTWGTDRFGAVTVHHEPRRDGVSGYSIRKLVAHTMNLVTGFTILPLQIASMMGFGLSFFGFGILCYVLIRYFLQGDSVPGFPFLASIVAILSGAQLFAIGIVGEYMARMHFRSMKMPSYVIRTYAGVDDVDQRPQGDRDEPKVQSD